MVDPATGFVWDGKNRTGDGHIDKDWEFTYCQGVFIGAGVELYGSRATRRICRMRRARWPRRRQHCPCPLPERSGARARMTWKATWACSRGSSSYGYLIPSQMFAVVVLDYMAQIYRKAWGAEIAADDACALRAEIEGGLRRFATVEHPQHGLIYAYETDGLGHHLLMDDANMPSLLSAPYLGYCSPEDPVYVNTRRFILSKANPAYAEGSVARGVGSPHTPPGMVWHNGLPMRGLTATDPGWGSATGRRHWSEHGS